MGQGAAGTRQGCRERMLSRAGERGQGLGPADKSHTVSFSKAVYDVFSIPQLLPWFAPSWDISGQAPESQQCNWQPSDGGFLLPAWLPGKIPPEKGPFSAPQK